MFPYMAKVQDDKDKVLNMTRWFLKMGTYVVFPIMIGLCSVADSFVEAVLTEKWLPCVPYMQIFCVSYMFNIVHSGNLESIKAIGRSDITLVMEIIKKSVYCLIIVLFVMLSKNPIVLAVSSLVCTMVALVINTYPNRKYIGYKYRYQIRDILPNLLLALMMGVCVWGIGLVVKSAIIRLVMQIVVGGFVYLFLSAITKNECFIFCFTYVKRILKRN